MGLSAFNRAREQRVQENAAADKAAKAELAAKEKADKTAAAAASKLISAIDTKAPDTVSVVGARVSYNTLTAAQAELVKGVSTLEAAEKTLLKKLVGSTESTPSVPAGDPPEDGGAESTGAADGENPPEQRGG